MVFSSSVFLFLFLPITLTGYFVTPRRMRNILLLLASLIFYAWGEDVYVALMAVCIGLNYTLGLVIDRQLRGRSKPVSAKLALVVGLSCNVLLLVYFKYANFAVHNVNVLLQAIRLAKIDLAPVHLPIGVSFFTFQAMSYLIDIYRRETTAQRNPINCALYISLFPQLIAGPIVRYHDIAKQLVARTITAEKFSSGVQRFILGLSKKVLLANPLGEVADHVFGMQITDLTTDLSWLGIVCYTLQIYFDFSGYSDMAIGLGRIFGFELLENFNYPYISQSVREFWRRWHISLATWFRDYVYIPLGGSRRSTLRTYFNLWVVFLLCGFWHGASWNFVIWGALHGSCLVIERVGFGGLVERMWRPIRHVYTIVFIMITWVFFRSETLGGAVSYLRAMFGLSELTSTKDYALLHCDPKIVITLIAGCLLAMPISRGIVGAAKRLASRSESFVLQGAFFLSYYFVLLGLLLLSVSSLAAGTYNPFIYFRF